MTLYAGTIVDTPGDPFAGDPADALAEVGALLVCEGVICARGTFAALRAKHPDEPVIQLPGGMLVPGFIDTHVHFPQIRAIGGLGTPLLDWLERCALPRRAKLADQAYAHKVASEFLDGLLASGTTSALVFGSHFPAAMDELFAAAGERGLNITSGLVLSDRILRPDLLHSPQTALADSTDLIGRWHGHGRLRYAVTLDSRCPRPTRCSTSARSCSKRASGSPRTSTRTWPRSPQWPGCSPMRGTTWIPTASTAWSPSAASSPTTSIPATPSSRCWPRTGRRSRTARPATAPWAAGCSRCAGTSSTASASRSAPTSARGAGLFLPKEALQAYFIQQMLDPDGLNLTPVHLLYLATRAGARALGLDDRVGDFSVGKDFDAVRLRPAAGSTLAVNLKHADDTTDALARIFSLATPADVAEVWIRGRAVMPGGWRGRPASRHSS